MNQLSKEAIEAIEQTNCFANEQKSDAYRQGATEALTNPEIYEKAGLMQTDGLLPESFNNEKVLTLLAISLRNLNAEQLANLLKSITQRSKEATEKAGLISLDKLDDFLTWARGCSSKFELEDNANWYPSEDADGDYPHTTAQLFQIYKQQKQ